MKRGILTAFLFIIFIAAVGKDPKPKIVGHKGLQTEQGQSITLALTDLTVQTEQGAPYPGYPSGFSLEVFDGNSYNVSGNTVTPDGNFVGTLSVPVRVRVGKEKSDKFNVNITVTARQQSNSPPVIIGQVTLKTRQGRAITIRLADLFVNDADDAYPSGFTLKIQTGTNYTVSGTTVQPAPGFVGALVVPVIVNDGEVDSAPFNLTITVEAGNNNVPPVITGQNTVNTVKGQPVAIGLQNLTVNDPDNRYPDDFTLNVLPGNNYTVSGTTVTPPADFIGALPVNVTVSDGTNTSNTFALRVTVVDNAQLEIIGQNELVVNEDTPIQVRLEDLKVNDPSKKYPSGFQLTISAGENYSVKESTITPAADFSGNLQVPVKVTNGNRESQVFNVLIRVIPVNDPPVLAGLSEQPVNYLLGGDPIFIARDLTITDPDDELLNMAEVGFETGYYQPGGDALIPSYNAAAIRVVFDPVAGTLFLIGEAPLSEYMQVLRSVSYQFTASDTLQPQQSKVIYFAVNDGAAMSERKSLTVRFEEEVALDIPNVFTPNDDNANDTWRVRILRGSDSANLLVRVYSQRGVLVYQTADFDVEWDGRLDGKQLPADNYYYIIELTGLVSKKVFTGPLTILR